MTHAPAPRSAPAAAPPAAAPPAADDIDAPLPPGSIVPLHPDTQLARLMAFVPVPRERARRDGWTAARQAGFLTQLARIGSIPAAARAVGMRPRGLYRLLDAPGADSFNRAFDAAMEIGRDRVRDAAVTRAIEGELVPRLWRGQIVGQRRVYNDRLLLAVLLGRRTEGSAGFPRHAERRLIRELLHAPDDAPRGRGREITK